MKKKKEKTSRQRRLTREDKKLARQIRRLREKRSLSQEELSSRIGANLSYIAYVETDRRGLSLPMLYKVAKVFGVKVKDLFSF